MSDLKNHYLSHLSLFSIPSVFLEVFVPISTTILLLNTRVARFVTSITLTNSFIIPIHFTEQRFLFLPLSISNIKNQARRNLTETADLDQCILFRWISSSVVVSRTQRRNWRNRRDRCASKSRPWERKSPQGGRAKGPLREPAPEQEKTTHCDAMYAQRVAPWD